MKIIKLITILAATSIASTCLTSCGAGAVIPIPAKYGGGFININPANAK